MNDATLREEVETARDLFLKGRGAWLRIIGRKQSIQLGTGIMLIGGVLVTNICYKCGSTGVADFLFWWPYVLYIMGILVLWYATISRKRGYKRAANYLNIVWPPESGGKWKWTDMPCVLKVAKL